MTLKRKLAFTLAEVLITLGIIGVVAAITMPMLIQNYQKTVYVNQLKKSVSTLEQGFQKMLADEGVGNLSDLPYWKSYAVYHDDDGTNNLVDNIFAKGFKVTYKKQLNYHVRLFVGDADDYDNHIQFPDSSSIVEAHSYGGSVTDATCNKIKNLGGNLCSIAMDRLVIDVNGGSKGPNQLGRDVFFFVVSNGGKLYPMAGKDYALYYNQTDLASNASYWKNNNSYNCSSSDETKRLGCTARIIENGWKMDY